MFCFVFIYFFLHNLLRCLSLFLFSLLDVGPGITWVLESSLPRTSRLGLPWAPAPTPPPTPFLFLAPPPPRAP